MIVALVYRLLCLRMSVFVGLSERESGVQLCRKPEMGLRRSYRCNTTMTVLY